MCFVNRGSRSFGLVLLASIAFASSSLGVTPAFASSSADLVPVRDNTLYEDPAGAVSNGQGIHCFAGQTFNTSRRRSLFAFDLSAIPTGATVLTVELRLTLDRAAPVAGAHPMTLHRMTASWGEGTSVADPFTGGQGAASTANDATWLHRFYPSTLWTAPGGDFDPATLATTSVSETFGVYQWGSTPEMVAVVQSWVSDPATNFGWMLRGDEEVTPTSRRFFTREAANASDAPHLLITYDTPTASELPVAHALRFDPATPNPFNPSTTLRWEAPTAGLVRITVCDARGAVVARPFEGVRPAGPQTYAWQARGTDGKSLASGVYVVRLEHGGQARSQRVVLVR